MSDDYTMHDKECENYILGEEDFEEKEAEQKEQCADAAAELKETIMAACVDCIDGLDPKWMFIQDYLSDIYDEVFTIIEEKYDSARIARIAGGC